MAQPWSAVEQSPEYQKLPPPEQSAAKEQYFSQVVAQKPEFQALPEEEKQAAAHQFLGESTTPQEDPRAGNFEAQMTKELYKTVPFGKRIVDTLAPNDAQDIQSTPEAKGFWGNAGKMVGGALGVSPAMVTGSEVLPATPMLGAALGAGAQETAGQLQEGKGPVQAGVSGAATTAGTYLGGKVLEGAVNASGEVLKPVSEKISDTISNLYNKAVKPTIVKGNSAILQKANDNVESGVRAIINNKDNLSLGEEGVQLPENLQHTSQAIADTKDAIFNQYNDLQKQATGKGVTISGEGLAQSLQPIINDKALDVVSPSTKKYAVDLFERLQNAGDISPEEAQDMIKGFNGRLKAYYRNPSPDQYGNTAVDALVANNARKVLDDAISNAVGEGYQGLKNQYGALSSMEKDVSRAAQRAANYQNKGLLDFSDILTGEQVLRGVMSGNPIEIATGTGGRLIKEYYKKLNSPNAVIKDMFQKVDKYMGQEGQPSFADKLAAVGQTVKDKVSGLADMIPDRSSLGMAGRAGSKAPAQPVEAELVDQQPKALPPPAKAQVYPKYPQKQPEVPLDRTINGNIVVKGPTKNKIIDNTNPTAQPKAVVKTARSKASQVDLSKGGSGPQMLGGNKGSVYMGGSKEADDIINNAKKLYGTTNDIKEAGYLLPDGSMLDFTGRTQATGYKNGKPLPGEPDYLKGRRNIDHREISDVIGEGANGNNPMHEFVNIGNIRLQPNGIELNQSPTSKQLQIIKQHILNNKGESFFVDIVDHTGHIRKSLTYEWPNVKVSSVINDMKKYLPSKEYDLMGVLGPTAATGIGAAAALGAKNANAKSGESNQLSPKQQKILKSVIWAESNGGSPEEIKATTSTFLNLIDKKGFKKAMLDSSAYRTQSKEYLKALNNKFNAYEKPISSKTNDVVDSLLSGKQQRDSYTKFENVKQFGEPKWARGQNDYRDIGRQRYYNYKEKGR